MRIEVFFVDVNEGIKDEWIWFKDSYGNGLFLVIFSLKKYLVLLEKNDSKIVHIEIKCLKSIC